MKPANRSFVLIAKLGLTALVICCTAWQLRSEFGGFSWSDLRASPEYFVASCLVFIIYMISSSLIWLYLTRLHGVAIGAGRTIAIWCYSIFGKYVPGKLLLWGIRFYLYKRERPDVSAIGLVRCCLLEYICGITAAVVLVLGSLAIVDFEIVTQRQRLAAGLLLAISLCFLHPKVLHWMAARLGHVLGLARDSAEVRTSDTARALVLYVINWLILGLSIFLVARCVHPIAWNDYLFVAASYALAGTIGFLAVFAPSGLGVREAILIGALGQIMPLSSAAVVAVAARLVSTLGEILSAGGMWLLDRHIRSARVIQRREVVTIPSETKPESLGRDE